MSGRPLDARGIAERSFTRRKADGTVVEWHQEDELAVKTKAEAVAMVQRTIDFWLPSLVHDLQIARNLALPDAISLATTTFSTSFEEMLANPFPRQWNMVLEDFDFTLKE